MLALLFAAAIVTTGPNTAEVGKLAPPPGERLTACPNVRPMLTPVADGRPRPSAKTLDGGPWPTLLGSDNGPSIVVLDNSPHILRDEPDAARCSAAPQGEGGEPRSFK